MRARIGDQARGSMLFIFAVSAARRTMPNGFDLAPCFHAGAVDRAQGSPIPFGIVWDASRRSFGWKQVRLPRSYG